MKKSTTNLAVTGLGVLVSGLGAKLFRKTRAGAGILGFGLAHAILGVLDMLRPRRERD